MLCTSIEQGMRSRAASGTSPGMRHAAAEYIGSVVLARTRAASPPSMGRPTRTRGFASRREVAAPGVRVRVARAGRAWIVGRLPSHVERLKPPERWVGKPRRVVHGCQMRVSTQQPTERDLRLEARELRSEAEVGPPADILRPAAPFWFPCTPGGRDRLEYRRCQPRRQCRSLRAGVTQLAECRLPKSDALNAVA